MYKVIEPFNKIFDNTTEYCSEFIHQVSYRSIIKKDNRFLMIKSNRGDIIFPGGRIEAGETEEQAVSRELREETGYEAITTPQYLGTILSRKDDKFKVDGVFEIECRYYTYDVSDVVKKRELTNHEIDLGLTTMWLTKKEIVKNNRVYWNSLEVKDFWVDQIEWLLGEEWQKKTIEGEE